MNETHDTSTNGRERKSTTFPDGTKVCEAGHESRVVASPSDTVHEREEQDDGEGYHLDPKCGQTLPNSSLWGSVEAESVVEAVLRFDLEPCTKCFTNSSRLREWRSAVHSNSAYSSPEDVPDDALREAGLSRYLNPDSEHTDK